MAYITLDQWDAAELFCRVLVKFDKKLKLDQLQDNELLLHQLEIYSEGESYLNVSGKVFGYIGDKNSKATPRRPKAFYELSRKVRNSIPAVLANDEYIGFMRYIKLPLDTFHYRRSTTWEPSSKQRRLEGTKWLLYYLHRDGRNANVPVNKYIHKSGIATAVLELKPFAKAEIRGFKSEETYEGKFEIYGKEERFIRLVMRLKEHKKKDLHMLIYIGDGVVELALAQYHNLGRSIYSGTVMLEPLSKEAKDDLIYFHTGDEIKKLPDHVQTYFSDKAKNMLRVPCLITSVTDFEEWQGSTKANSAK